MGALWYQAEKRGDGGNEAVQQTMTGAAAVTAYNLKMYKVERADFAQSHETCFDKQGTQISYSEYYKTKSN